MVLFPNAKINLGLEILRKREDGFHDIDSVFYPIPFFDALEVVVGSQLNRDEWHYSGLPIPGSDADNLCVKALNLLRERKEIPKLNSFLHKSIPMGAGLGGGSADASFYLKGLNDMFELDLNPKELEEMALSLGSDCPFFINNVPAHAQGRGQLLGPIDLNLKGKHLILICPDIHVSTGGAYSTIAPDETGTSPAELVKKPIEEWRDSLRNRFEEYAFNEHPLLAEIKQELYKRGALYASMSGSGAAMYGVFKAAADKSQFSKFGSTHSIEL